MDRRWMYARRDSLEYAQGMKMFISFALKHVEDPNSILCPCVDCNNTVQSNVDGVWTHLVTNGINQAYKFWIKHGESINSIPLDRSGKETTEGLSKRLNDDTQDRDDSDDIMFNENFDVNSLDELTQIIGENLQDCPEMFKTLCNDANTPLYKGCSKYSKLSALLKLYAIKARGSISDSSFTSLLEAFKDMLPDDNVLPSRIYEAKKMLNSIGMSCKRIHACPNDCILYRKENASLDCCPICQASRYQKENVPAKVMWYFPIIPRFRRLYGIAEDAKNLTWHVDREKKRDGKLRHPADSPQWIKIDNKFPEFKCEPRNLRLALASELSTAMESRIKAMELEIQEWKKKQQGNVEPSTHNKTTELEPSNGETEIPEGITNCQLALSEPSYRIVATGQVHNIGTTMHTQQLRPGHVRVMVINAFEECTTLPVPIPGEATVISEAKQTFVLWPKELIIIDQSVDLSKKKDKVVELENSSKIQCNNEEIDLTGKKSGKVVSLKVKTLEVPLKPLEEVGSSTVVSPQNSSNGYPNKESLNVEMLPSILQLFYRYVSRMSNDQQVMIPINIALRNTLRECHIGKEQFLQFLAQEKIGAVHIAIYMSLKNQELKYKNVHHFGFLCPSEISLATTKFKDFKMTQHNQRSRSEYILNVLNLEANKGKVFLAPYNVGLHWILCVIDPYDDVVYYLDSLRQSPITRVDLLEVVETALLLFRSQKEIYKKMKRITKWIKIQCPNQSNYIDCGYYVMRYIKEIIDYKEIKIPETYYAGHIYQTYTKELIDEVRIEWVNHLLPYL